MQGLKDNAQRAVGVLTGLTPDSAPAKPKIVDRIAQNADGEWMLDGEIVRCSLGGHEGKARARLLATQFQEADVAGRTRLLKEWS
jgi:hypothetical protein